MLDVLVMKPTETDAVGGIERSSALPDADDVVKLDRSAAALADTFELAAIIVP
jgi:hypothetical protein